MLPERAYFENVRRHPLSAVQSSSQDLRDIGSPTILRNADTGQYLIRQKVWLGTRQSAAIHKDLRNFSKISSLFRIRFRPPPCSANFAFRYKHPRLSRKRDTRGCIRKDAKATVCRSRTELGYFGPFPTNGHPRSNKETWNIQPTHPVSHFSPIDRLSASSADIPLPSRSRSSRRCGTALGKEPGTR